MAAYGWGQSSSLSDWLYDEPQRFDFFQAVSLLERMAEARGEKCVPVGEGAEPRREAVRFESSVDLHFAPTDVEALAREQEKGGRVKKDGQPTMTVNFMGLAGAMGPLDAPLTELVIERAWRYKDHAPRAFLDIFNHRLVSLLYRIRKQHRVGLDAREPGRDRHSLYFYSVAGLGTPSLRGRMQVRDRSLLPFAGLLGQQPRSAAGLERVVSGHFGVPARVRQFVGRWLRFDEEQQTRIGRTGRNQRLGAGAIVGTRAWDQQGAFEVVLGPLTMKQFEEFLPTGWGFRPLCDLVRFYVGDGPDFSFRLTLKHGEATPTRLAAARLGQTSRLGAVRLSKVTGARLGWTSWLKGAESSDEEAQVVISPASLRAFADVPDVPYLRLPPDKLEELIGRMKERRFGPDQTVVRQGDEGHSMFVIRSGSVKVVRRDEYGRDIYLGALGAGDYFGEMALITSKVRQATVTTLEECRLLELRKETLAEFTAKYPRLAAALRDYAELRLEENRRWRAAAGEGREAGKTVMSDK